MNKDQQQTKEKKEKNIPVVVVSTWLTLIITTKKSIKFKELPVSYSLHYFKVPVSLKSTSAFLSIIFV